MLSPPSSYTYASRSTLVCMFVLPHTSFVLDPCGSML